MGRTRSVTRTAAVAACAIILGAATASAQEFQVALDEHGRVTVVDARTARQLGVFLDQYPGFQEARLYQHPDGGFVLEISAEQDGRVVRQRVPMSVPEVEDLRRRITERMAERAPALGLDQEGRSQLLWSLRLWGGSYYSWAIPVALNIESAAVPLLIAGGSFFAPLVITRDAEISLGTAAMTRFGLASGAANGALLNLLIEGGQGFEDWTEDDELNDRTRRILGMSVAASMGSGYAGYRYAQRKAVAPGPARALGFGYGVGLANGWAGVLVLQPEDVSLRMLSGLTLAFGAGGAVAAFRAADRFAYSDGGIDILWTLQFLGLTNTLMLGSFLDLESVRGVAGLIMLNSTAAAVAGHHLVRDRHFTRAHSRIMGLGALSGGTLGIGLLYLLSVEDEKAYTTAMNLGAIGGFAFTYRMFAHEARLGMADPDASRRSNLSFRFSPEAMLTNHLGPAPAGKLPPPVFRLEYRF